MSNSSHRDSVAARLTCGVFHDQPSMPTACSDSQLLLTRMLFLGEGHPDVLYAIISCMPSETRRAFRAACKTTEQWANAVVYSVQLTGRDVALKRVGSDLGSVFPAASLLELELRNNYMYQSTPILRSGFDRVLSSFSTRCPSLLRRVTAAIIGIHHDFHPWPRSDVVHFLTALSSLQTLQFCIALGASEHHDHKSDDDPELQVPKAVVVLYLSPQPQQLKLRQLHELAEVDYFNSNTCGINSKSVFQQVVKVVVRLSKLPSWLPVPATNPQIDAVLNTVYQLTSIQQLTLYMSQEEPHLQPHLLSRLSSVTRLAYYSLEGSSSGDTTMVNLHALSALTNLKEIRVDVQRTFHDHPFTTIPLPSSWSALQQLHTLYFKWTLPSNAHHGMPRPVMYNVASLAALRGLRHVSLLAAVPRACANRALAHLPHLETLRLRLRPDDVLYTEAAGLQAFRCSLLAASPRLRALELHNIVVVDVSGLGQLTSLTSLLLGFMLKVQHPLLMLMLLAAPLTGLRSLTVFNVWGAEDAGFRGDLRARLPHLEDLVLW